MSEAIDPLRYYSTGAAARLTGLGHEALVRRIKAGQIPAVCPPPLPGGRWSWRKVKGSNLIAFLKRCGVEPQPLVAPERKTRPPMTAKARLAAALAELDALD